MLGFILVLLSGTALGSAHGTESLIIAASPSVAEPLEALGQLFEREHPEVKVRIYLDSGGKIRQAIAGMENDTRGRYFIGTGPIHIVAPGGDEFITRLEQKYYVLPGTQRPYATVPLVLVVPESLVEAPASFEALAKDESLRIAIGDPELTTLGRKTKELLTALGLWSRVESRLDRAADVRGVLDHVLNGQADVGILFGPDAAKERERVRITAVANRSEMHPVVHSVAMERYCPNRDLCGEFLDFVQSPEAQTVLVRLGYGAVK